MFAKAAIWACITAIVSGLILFLYGCIVLELSNRIATGQLTTLNTPGLPHLRFLVHDGFAYVLYGTQKYWVQESPELETLAHLVIVTLRLAVFAAKNKPSPLYLLTVPAVFIFVYILLGTLFTSFLVTHLSPTYPKTPLFLFPQQIHCPHSFEMLLKEWVLLLPIGILASFIVRYVFTLPVFSNLNFKRGSTKVLGCGSEHLVPDEQVTT